MTQPRRTFGPVVLLVGLASGALAMAATQDWFVPEGKGVYRCDAPCTGLTYGDAGATAWPFALVMLAALGVVLVSRGRVRRLVCVVGLLASVAAVVVAVEALVTGPDQVRDFAQDLGTATPDVASTGWCWIGVAASLLAVGGWVAAVAYVRQWPEMGRRYDTPAGDAPEDLWKAMDHGHDPTS